MVNDRLKFASLIFATFIIFLLSCGQSLGPELENAIKGRIVNGEGDPVPDALINISYYFKPILSESQFIQNENKMATIIISYTVPEKQRVKIWITRHHEIDTTRLLVDMVHHAGYHQVVWDGRNKENELEISDFYDVHIAYPNKLITNSLILNNDYAAYTVMDNLAYYSKTTDDGKFFIRKSGLMHHKLDFELIWTDEQGNPMKVELLPYIKIWGLQQNYLNTFKDSIYINLECVTEILLQFDG